MKKDVCVLVYIRVKGEVGAYFISGLFLLCFRVRLFIDALWSPAGKGLTSWLSFMMSNSKSHHFPIVSWVRCGA